MKYLAWDESLFKNREVFDVSYLPDTLLHREAQLNQLASNMRLAFYGATPVNTLCIGPPSTGKTSAVKIILSELKDKCLVSYINCRDADSRFRIFSQIFTDVCGGAVRKGISFETLYLKLMERIEGEILIICFDDLNYLLDVQTLNYTFHALLKAHEKFNVKIAIIGISPDLDIYKKLDPFVGSIFHADEVHFPLYKEKEMRDILLQRVRLGFYEGAITQDAFELAVKLAHENANLRLGIFLLKMAGIEAERRASRKIEVQDIEEAYTKGRHLFLEKSLSALSPDEILVLRTIYETDTKTAGELFEILRKDIYYEKLNKIIRKLENVRLIDTTLEYSKGKRLRIMRRYDTEFLLDALERISS